MCNYRIDHLTRHTFLTSGSVHGQYHYLLQFFELFGFPSESPYLFLGNYVDHGEQSLETICLLLAYKIKYPETFFLLRGAHESSSVYREHGFFDECKWRPFQYFLHVLYNMLKLFAVCQYCGLLSGKRRYNIRLWRAFTDCFNCMPVAAIIDEKVFCVSGGEDIQYTMTMPIVYATIVMCELNHVPLLTS